MAFKYIYLIALTYVCVHSKSSFKICVPSQYLKSCQEMANAPTKSKTQIECVPGRDRMDCLNLVQQRQADIVPVDPEDMYCATKIQNQDFVVVQEYRTEEEPDVEDWKREANHVQRLEKEYWVKDRLQEQQEREFIISLGGEESSSESEEEENDSDNNNMSGIDELSYDSS